MKTTIEHQMAAVASSIRDLQHEISRTTDTAIKNELVLRRVALEDVLLRLRQSQELTEILRRWMAGE